MHWLPTSASARLRNDSCFMMARNIGGNVTFSTEPICELTCAYVIMMRAGCHRLLTIATMACSSASLSFRDCRCSQRAHNAVSNNSTIITTAVVDVLDAVHAVQPLSPRK